MDGGEENGPKFFIAPYLVSGDPENDLKTQRGAGLLHRHKDSPPSHRSPLSINPFVPPHL